MSTKPESQFISGVHGHLDRSVYRMKNHNPYVGGVADCYYSGDKGDLWVEYKFVVLPKRASTPITAALTPLQIAWLTGRATEGRNVAVIVGCASGGVVFNVGEIAGGDIPSEIFRARLQSRVGLAEWIRRQTKR